MEWCKENNDEWRDERIVREEEEDDVTMKEEDNIKRLRKNCRDKLDPLHICDNSKEREKYVVAVK